MFPRRLSASIIALLLVVGSLVDSQDRLSVTPPEGAQSVSESDGTGREAFEIIATNTADIGPQALAPIRCHGAYDYPHRSTSSKRRAINAHLTVTCKGGRASLTRITANTRMTDNTGRMGRINFHSGNGRVKAAGELGCTRDRRLYRSVAVVQFVFPAGYTPKMVRQGAASVHRPFQQSASGVCL